MLNNSSLTGKDNDDKKIINIYTTCVETKAGITHRPTGYSLLITCYLIHQKCHKNIQQHLVSKF